MRSNTFPSVLLALVVAGWVHGRSEAQDPPAAPKPAETAAPAAEAKAAPVAAVPEVKPLPPETPPPVVPEGMLMLNFRGAPLESVLNYLSDAAGYIIVTESEVRGKLDVISKQPVTKDEAFTILESALARNGYTALRNGRTLTIVSKEGARKRDIPVKSGNDPEAIPKDEQMVTQIIPVRFISATQLTTDLQPLLPSEATMTANDAGNALVITDTQSSIRRLAEIIRALDTSLAGANSVKVYPLRFSDAKEVANVIKELYPAQSSSTTGGNNARGGAGGFGGFPGFPGGAMGGGGRGGAAASSGGGNRAAASRVVAVADEHSNSLIVNAPEDAMPAIEELIRSIDTNVQDVTELRVFRLQNSDPVEMAEVLAGLFPDPTTSTDNRQNRFGGGFGMFGGGGRGNAATTGTSERAKKKGRVITVPDQRTSSIIVSADHEMMDQIAEMVKQLDTNPARKQKVYVYDLQNADPQQVQEVLRGLFESQSTANRNTQSRNQQNSALSTRSTQQQNNGNRAATGFGGGGGGGGGGAGGGGGGVGGR